MTVSRKLVYLKISPNMTRYSNFIQQFRYSNVCSQIGVTNRHTQQLPSKDDPGNFALTIALTKPDDNDASIDLPFPSDQEVYQTLAISAAETLVIDLESR